MAGEPNRICEAEDLMNALSTLVDEDSSDCDEFFEAAAEVATAGVPGAALESTTSAAEASGLAGEGVAQGPDMAVDSGEDADPFVVDVRGDAEVPEVADADLTVPPEEEPFVVDVGGDATIHGPQATADGPAVGAQAAAEEKEASPKEQHTTEPEHHEQQLGPYAEQESDEVADLLLEQQLLQQAELQHEVQDVATVEIGDDDDHDDDDDDDDDDHDHDDADDEQGEKEEGEVEEEKTQEEKELLDELLHVAVNAADAEALAAFEAEVAEAAFLEEEAACARLQYGDDDEDDRLPELYPLLTRYAMSHPGALAATRSEAMAEMNEEESSTFGAPCWACGSRSHYAWRCPERRCYLCGQSAHEGSGCPERPRRCAHCRLRGHTIQACPTFASEEPLGSLAAVRCLHCGRVGHINCAEIVRCKAAVPKVRAQALTKKTTSALPQLSAPSGRPRGAMPPIANRIVAPKLPGWGAGPPLSQRIAAPKLPGWLHPSPPSSPSGLHGMLGASHVPRPKMPTATKAAGGSWLTDASASTASRSATKAAIWQSPRDFTGDKAAGYVFLCAKSTQRECETLSLFGSPQRELPQMKRCIAQDTQLFLFNFETKKVVGIFAPDGEPEQDIVKGSFGGRFSAQLRFVPLQEPILEACWEQRMFRGPITASMVESLRAKLHQGDAVGVPRALARRSSTADVQLPAAKRLRLAAPGALPRGSIAKEAAASAPMATKAKASAAPAKVALAATPTALTSLTSETSGERPFDMGSVVVNFANVGATYAEKVLRKDSKRGERLFDWEGVRRCVRFLREELDMKVIGVVFENFFGPDAGSHQTCIPSDIRSLCNSIQETPRLTGRNHKSADDEMTIKCAHRRNCRFLDNDNYRDWLKELRVPACRAWLQKYQDLLQMRYYFDTDLGSFETLDGNVSAETLGFSDGD